MRDLRTAVRTIASRPWFSAAIVLTLAIGIGINTTVFTLVYAVLWKPLPFPNGHRIVTVVSTDPAARRLTMDVSDPDFRDLRTQATSFEALAAVAMQPAVMAEGGHPAERYRMARVAPEFFRILGTAATMGRTLQPVDVNDDAPPVAVIGYDVWRARYNGAADIVGHTVRINEHETTIVGVMPDGFHMPSNESVWIPYQASSAERAGRSNRFLLVMGLLKPGVTSASATSEINGIAARLAAAYPENKGIGAAAVSFNERFNGGQIQTVFMLLIAAVGLVLLIACANVANMMLSRAVSRRREMTIRSALGASRWRLIQQMLTEALLLSAAGGAGGIVIALWGARAFDAAVANTGKPSWVLFTMEYTVLAYFATICVLAAILFGLAPALRSSRVELNHVLKEGGRGGSGRIGWLSSTLVVLQFTFAVVLLTGAGLMIRSFLAGQSQNSWIPRDRIVVGRMELPKSRYAARADRIRFFDALDERLRGLPGLARASFTSALPEQGASSPRIEIDGAPPVAADARPRMDTVSVSDGYFDVIDLRLERGRRFTASDGDEGRETAIVTRSLAEKFWPGADPIGRRFRVNDSDSQPPGPWITVIGISADLVQANQDPSRRAVAFVPYRQSDPTSLTMAGRTAGDPAALGAPLRALVQSIDPDLPVFDVQSLEAISDRQRWPYRVFGTIFGIFAIAALVMASVGLYAVMSQATARRTREIGIRMALGATPSRIQRAVLLRGSLQLSIGLVLGLGAAFLATGAMRSILLGVTPGDPIVFSTTAVLLTAIGLLACWLPARRAAAVAPVRALAEGE
jgi:predicted permease